MLKLFWHYRKGDDCAMRIGSGYDVHRLAANRPLYLCGVQITAPYGLEGHSDADVAIHALCDALLGAVAQGDIGVHFPPGDPEFKDIRSTFLLERCMTMVQQAGYSIGNIDITIIAERPRLAPYRDEMRQKLAAILNVTADRVSVKATTTEGLGFAGRGEGIAAEAVVLLE